MLDFLGCLAVQVVVAGIAVFAPAYPVAWFRRRRGWTEKQGFRVYVLIVVPVIFLAIYVSGRICSLF